MFAHAAPSRAQDFAGVGDAETNLNVFRYARPGEVIVQVWVWGAAASGLYEVNREMTIDKLLTLTGGPSAVLSRDRRTRYESTVRLYRQQDSRRVILYEEPIETVLVEPDYPQLANGDILVFETITSRRFGWRDAVSILSAVGTVFLVGDRISRVF